MSRPARGVYGEVLVSGFVPACLLLAAMFGVLAIWHPLSIGGSDGQVMGVVAGTTGLLFAGVALLIRRRTLTAPRAHPAAAALAVVAFLNCVLQYALTRHAVLTVDVLLVMIGVSLCLVDPRWTTPLLATFAVAWVALVGVLEGSRGAADAAPLVAVAAVVAALAVVVRLGTLHRLLDTQAELRALSQRDELTGLLNRRGFLDAAQVALERGRPVRLWFLDVDDLKVVNDTQGHDVGDVLLISVAAALTDVFAGGIVARLSGDEFAVLEDHGADAGLMQARDALDVRLELASRVTGLRVSVSTGTANAEPGSALSDLLTAADAAMYATKQARHVVRLPGSRMAVRSPAELTPPLFDEPLVD